MPGEHDLAHRMLPQPPVHQDVLPQAAALAARDQRLRSTTNPYSASIQGTV